MFNLAQQPPQEHFPFLSELEQRVHPLVNWCLAGMGLVGGYFWGIGQSRLPVVLCMALGLVGGLLLVGLLKHAATIALGAAIVLAVAGATFFLLQNDAALKAHGTAAAHDTAPAQPGWLEKLLNEVKP